MTILLILYYALILVALGLYLYNYLNLPYLITKLINYDGIIIIEIGSNNSKLFALVDTGSDCSYIDECSLDFFRHSKCTYTKDLIVDNSTYKQLEKKCSAEFSIKNNLFINTFFIHNLSNISKQYNKGIDMILGNDFLIENKLTLNLHKMTLEKYK